MCTFTLTVSNNLEWDLLSQGRSIDVFMASQKGDNYEYVFEVPDVVQDLVLKLTNHKTAHLFVKLVSNSGSPVISRTQLDCGETREFIIKPVNLEIEARLVDTNVRMMRAMTYESV